MDQFQTSDLVLLAISQYPGGKVPYEDRDDLARLIDRSSITLKKNLTTLKKQDLISKERSFGKFNFELTEEGRQRLKMIYKELDNYYFTPQRHFIPNSVRFMDVMNTIKNSEYRIYLTSLYFSKESFDLLETLDTFKLFDNDTSIYNLVGSESMFNTSTDISNFVHSFMDSTMYGIQGSEDENMNQRDHEVLLINADMRVARGDLEEALELYDNVLKMTQLTQDIWFIAIVGKIRTLAKLERREELHNALQETRKAIDNKMALGYLNQIEADILGIEGETSKAKILFEKCIGTFRHYNHPVFLAIAYNNYGILMFNEERFDEAEKYWKQAKRCSIEGGSDIMQSSVLINLASITRMKGDVDKARKNLEKVRKIFEKNNNLEKLSDVEYNISLLYLTQDELEKAVEIFNKSILTTYPFLSKDRLKERVFIFKKESENHKYPPRWDGSKFNLTY